MSPSIQTEAYLSRGRLFFTLPIALWLLILATSFYYNWQHHNQTLMELATAEAQSSYNKDLAYRRWASLHGGVYVPPTDQTPPNPFLSHLENRDLTSTSGVKLTLINPAYMTRQVHELEREQYGTQGHITSLNPLRPENRPDPWESKALQAFTAGAKEVTSKEEINGQPFLRFMRPLLTEASCLKCHAGQGYKVGDIRGGISVSVPLAFYLEMGRVHTRQLVFTHAVIAALGLLALWAWRRRQQRYEQTLLASEEKYRIVADNTYDWEFWLGTNDDLRYISPSCQRITGYSQEEFLANPGLFEEIIHPDDRPIYGQHRHLASKGQQGPEEVCFRIRHRDGHELWIGHFCQPIFDRAQRFLGARGTNRDITDCKRNEDGLHARIALREYAMEHDLNSFLTKAVDEAERLTASSIGFIHFLDADQQTPRLRIWSTNTRSRLYSAEDQDAHHPLTTAGVWADCIHEQRPVIHNDYATLALRKELPTGHAPIIRVLTVPIIRDNQVLAVIGLGNKAEEYTTKDITTLSDFSDSVWDIVLQKRAEEERAKLETQLRQAQKMESIGTLAGGIAHDFNNILTAVLGYAELAHDDLSVDQPSHAYISEVLKAGERAKSLVQQILAFSRQSEQEFKPLQIHLVVKEAVKLLRSTIPTTVEIKQDINVNSGTVLADPTQIHQIVMNLCTNAYHAMREKGGTLAVGLSPLTVGEDDAKVNQFHLLPGTYIRLEVSDTGCGMNRLTLERIFDPYFTTKPKGEGTGLGLAVVHGIVKSCGGHITVYSEPGMGTTFRLYLPRLADQGQQDQWQEAVELPRGHERIMVVDDEETIASMEKTMLEGLGYQVTIHTDPREAVMAMQLHPEAFDLICTDMTMPHLNGTEVTKRVRVFRPGMPVILCTGFSELINEEKAKALGLDGYLTKPLLRKDLATTVRAALDRSPTAVPR